MTTDRITPRLSRLRTQRPTIAPGLRQTIREQIDKACKSLSWFTALALLIAITGCSRTKGGSHYRGTDFKPNALLRLDVVASRGRSVDLELSVRKPVALTTTVYYPEARVSLFVEVGSDAPLVLQKWSYTPTIAASGFKTLSSGDRIHVTLDLATLVDADRTPDGNYGVRIVYDDRDVAGWASQTGRKYASAGVVPSNLIETRIEGGKISGISVDPK